MADGVYIATREFKGLSETELNLRHGDRIIVTSSNGEWLYGKNGGYEGWFPANHAERERTNVPTSPVIPQPPMPHPVVPRPPAKPTPFHDAQENISRMKFAPPPAITPSSRNSWQGYNDTPTQSNNYRPHSTVNGGATRTALRPAPSPAPSTPFRPQSQAPSTPFRPQSQASAVPFRPQSQAPQLPQPIINNHMIGGTGGALTFQFVVETLHQYTGRTNEELSFASREKLDIIEKPSLSDDWYRARNKAGEMGLVPKSYVKDKPEQKTPVLADRLWYRYKITRVQTEELMRSKGLECYIIRDSEANPGWFTLSVKGPDKVRHIKITTTHKGYEVGDKKFPSLDAVVDFYRNSPVYIASDRSYQLFLSRPLTSRVQ